MEGIFDKNGRAHNSSEARINIFEDPKITMLPIVFTKKLDKMNSINTKWETLSFKKITTMLLEESKPEYNPRNISTRMVIDMNSYNKLESKLKTYLQTKKSQYKKLNLESIIEMALNNIKASTISQNVQKENSQASIAVKKEPESWSSDDDEALGSVIKRTVDIDKDNQSQSKTEDKSQTKPHKNTKSVVCDILDDTPIKNINQQNQLKKTKVRVKAEKNTTTVAEVQSQLKDFIFSPIRNSKTVSKIDDRVFIKVKRRTLPKDEDSERKKKNQTKVPTRPNINTKIVKDTITDKIINQNRVKKETKIPAEQNENKSPVALTNAVQNIKKKIKCHDIGGMSIYFFNTGLMAKQQKVAKERYDIGKDGTLEKFFVQSQPPRDFGRYSIEKTVCCLYKRAQAITEILDEYEISPTAINFLRAAHLCEVGACLCCCKPNRSAPQSDAARILDRKVANSLVPSNAPHASSSLMPLQNQNLYPTDNIIKTISAHYKLSSALKGFITSLLSNFKGITLTAGSTGKLSAVFNTTFTSWNNADLQLMTTILTKMRRELFISQIPPKDFCDRVNEAINKDNLYCQASTLLGSKQLLMMKQYSLTHFPVEKMKVSKSEDQKIEYFRGDPKLLETASVPGPSGLLKQENDKTKTKRKQRTITNDQTEKDQPRRKYKRRPKQDTRRELRTKSPKALRECVFVPESTAEEPVMPYKCDDTVVPIKNPMLQQMLARTAALSTSSDFGVTQMPLEYLVSVPVPEESNCKQVPLNNIPQESNCEQVPLNNIPQTDNIFTIDLSSDEETILP